MNEVTELILAITGKVVEAMEKVTIDGKECYVVDGGRFTLMLTPEQYELLKKVVDP